MAINVLREPPAKVALALSGMGAETMELVILEHRQEMERLRKALAEIVIRTMPYQDDHEGRPLVAGVHRVAHDALAESR